MIRPVAVFDCNVLLQAIANRDGPADQALRLLDENKIDLKSTAIRHTRHVFNYPRARQDELTLIWQLQPRQIIS